MDPNQQPYNPDQQVSAPVAPAHPIQYGSQVAGATPAPAQAMPLPTSPVGVPAGETSDKDYVVAVVLSFFFGGLGVDRYGRY